MSIYHLREEVAASFAVQPEFHMGFQVGRLIKNRKPVFILCAEIVLEFDQMLAAQIRTSSFRTWISNERDLDIQRAAFQKWVDDLLPPPAIELLGVRDAYVAVREINETPGFDPSTPSNMPPKGPDSATYGHLPFHRSTNDDEVFYRYELFPTSRRINQTTQLVARGHLPHRSRNCHSCRRDCLPLPGVRCRPFFLRGGAGKFNPTRERP